MPLLLLVAKATRQVLLQNLGIALVSICLASVPALTGSIPLWATVLVHEGSTVIVALNCLRLLMLKHPLERSARHGPAQSGYQPVTNAA